MQIEYTAPEHVRDVIASLGRTEDVRFSPNNRRLAIAGFGKSKITVFEVAIAASHNSKNITLADVSEISSAFLNFPHGLDFIDDQRLFVTNREGQACIFEIPLGATGSYELAPLAVLHSDHILTPGSVAVIRKERGLCEALICNNYVHRITRHQLDFRSGYSSKSGEIVLKRWLDIPDGICVSKEMQWIAVSNHSTHAVFLYENNSSLNELSNPDGILRGTKYPHGVRFTSDDRFVLVADAGTPYVNIYEKGNSSWRGVRDPHLSIRVMNNEDFLRGRHNREEGGPKGIDIHNTNIFVTTSEAQPLAFFDLAEILEGACRGAHGSAKAHNSNYLYTGRWSHAQETLEINYELYRARIEAAVTATLRSILRRLRITAALRWVLGRVRTLTNRKLILILLRSKNSHTEP